MDISTIVDGVIDFFGQRAGFDHWWDELDEDTQADIRLELGDLLEGLV